MIIEPRSAETHPSLPRGRQRPRGERGWARRAAAITWVTLLTFTGCHHGGGGAVPPAPDSGERIVFSDGTRVHLATFDGAGLTTVSTAEIPTEGLLAGHTIFGMVKHPTKPWLYVTSFNECQTGDDWCYGNARIDRFAVTRDAITWAGLAYDYRGATLPSCAAEDFGYPGQSGACAPVNGTFSADGTRLYVQEDSADPAAPWDHPLEIFEVDPEGALTMLSDGGNTSLHGVAMDPTGAGTYVYNGTNVLAVDGDVVTTVTPTVLGGNSTRYIPTAGADLLLTTFAPDASGIWDGFGMYSLADPADPQPVSSVSTVVVGGNRARAVALDGAMRHAVVVGRNSVKTYGWDGNAFTPQASFDPYAGTTIENRELALISGDTCAAVSFFVKNRATPSGFSGGVSVYGIDASGGISPLRTLRLPGSSGVVLSLKL